MSGYMFPSLSVHPQAVKKQKIKIKIKYWCRNCNFNC